MTVARDLPGDASQLMEFAAQVLTRVSDAALTIATAESCTGGLLASLCTDIEGLGSVFERGVVAYTIEAKHELLGIDPALIERHGVVSAEVASAMADGALARSPADIAVGVTGFAGAAGANDEPGLVYIAARRRDGLSCAREAHYGEVGRDRVRLLTANAAFEMIDELVEAEAGQAASS